MAPEQNGRRFADDIYKCILLEDGFVITEEEMWGEMSFSVSALETTCFLYVEQFIGCQLIIKFI